MTMRETLKQFFTPAKYSQILVDAITTTSPEKIIDLAMGEGSLLIEAKKRWPNSTFCGNDIDVNCCREVSKSCPRLNCTNFDIFAYTTIEKIIEQFGKVELCVGNPPFHRIRKSKDIYKLLKEFGIERCYKGDYIASEIPFILQSLKILKDKGTLALILPDGFFTNRTLSSFRSFLIQNYRIEKVIELPEKIFKNTPAKTHIMILTKSQNAEGRKIPLSNLDGRLLRISACDAVNRMDFSFYNHIKSSENDGELRLKDVAEIFRGKSRGSLKEVPDRYILHTTSMRKPILTNGLKSDSRVKKYAEKIAISGDIVLARVGTSVVGKIDMVKSGFFIPTDCIIVIRVSKDLVKMVFEALTSERGKLWIDAHKKGVAAKHITMEDIKNFPISIPGMVIND